MWDLKRDRKGSVTKRNRLRGINFQTHSLKRRGRGELEDGFMHMHMQINSLSSK